MVNLLKIDQDEIIEIILDEAYFSIYDLNVSMFGANDHDYDDVALEYKNRLPFVRSYSESFLMHAHVHLVYSHVDAERENFLRLMYDRHRFFSSACVDYSGNKRNHLMYILHDINLSCTDALVTRLWWILAKKIETENGRLLVGMRSLKYYKK